MGNNLRLFTCWHCDKVFGSPWICVNCDGCAEGCICNDPVATDYYVLAVNDVPVPDNTDMRSGPRI